MKVKLEKNFILELFEALNKELEKIDIVGELYLVGGAVMCLNFNARPSTMDVDAIFAPKTKIREAVKRVADNFDINENWLNDAVKGFLSPHGEYSPYLDLSNLKVFCAKPEYLFAMKSLSLRLGKEFHDEADLFFLMRYLNLTTIDDTLKIIEKYYDSKLVPQKTFYAISELLEIINKG